MEYFGLKFGQDLENRAANPYQKARSAPPPPPPGSQSSHKGCPLRDLSRQFYGADPVKLWTSVYVLSSQLNFHKWATHHNITFHDPPSNGLEFTSALLINLVIPKAFYCLNISLLFHLNKHCMSYGLALWYAGVVRKSCPSIKNVD